MTEYEQARKHAEQFYSELEPVYSPALGEEVYFNADGFGHILYRNSRTERELTSQMERFPLLPVAVRLIGFANTYQEYEIRRRRFEVTHDGERKYKPKQSNIGVSLLSLRERNSKWFYEKLETVGFIFGVLFQTG